MKNRSTHSKPLLFQPKGFEKIAVAICLTYVICFAPMGRGQSCADLYSRFVFEPGSFWFKPGRLRVGPVDATYSHEAIYRILNSLKSRVPNPLGYSWVDLSQVRVLNLSEFGFRSENEPQGGEKNPTAVIERGIHSVVVYRGMVYDPLLNKGVHINPIPLQKYFRDRTRGENATLIGESRIEVIPATRYFDPSKRLTDYWGAVGTDGRRMESGLYPILSLSDFMQDIGVQLN